jgi:hypothetical protein
MAEGTAVSERSWSGSELLAELRRFEAELRAAGLREHTVGTYVGRSETFVRWLRGEYTPRGPNSAVGETPPGATLSLGRSTLDDLRVNLSRDDIAHQLANYGAVTGYDASFRQLLRATGEHLDMQVESHRIAVIEWLRAWGCRHLRRADTQRTAATLEIWWAEWGPRLPGRGAVLTEISGSELAVIEQAYDALRTAPAAGRRLKDRDIDVVLGDTAAAKVMFANMPDVFLPWDEPIRLAFGWLGGGAAYVELLQLSAAALNGLASRLAVSVSELPKILGRPRSSPPKLVDEFLWIKITKGL